MTLLDFYKKLENKKLYDDPYYRALKYKLGNPLKSFDVKSDFSIMSLIEDESARKFLIIYHNVYVIPLELPGNEIFGFILKSIKTKNFLTVKLNGYEKYPLVYGLNVIDRYDVPIILVEGVKDAEAVKQVYKYCLAYLTSQPPGILFEYLKNITNKIIFIPDSDDVGKKLKFYNKYKQFSKYYSVDKDMGAYWNNYDRIYLDQIELILKMENINV